MDSGARPLSEFCRCDDGEDFVGIRYEKDADGGESPKIRFPRGFFGQKPADMPDDALRESVFDLFAVLSDIDLQNEAKQRSKIALVAETRKETSFPMVAYLNVIRNFLDCGYIVEKEVLYKKGAHGKVNWRRCDWQRTPRAARQK